MGYRVAIAGATGNVGRQLLAVLAERDFPADEVIALASRASVGKEVSFGDDETLKVHDLAEFDFSGTDIGLFSPGGAVSKVHAPRAAEQGCVVIDNTSQFRMDEDVPLVVPEVNGETIAGYDARNIIANPNCSTIQMVVALKPLHDHAHIKRIVVSTYQSTSGAGKQAMDELFEHTRAIYMNAREEPRSFAKTIAFNVVPADRPLRYRRLHRRRGQDGARDPTHSRSGDPRERHLRAGADLHRPRRVRECRVPRPNR